jgi:hypothetical protein
MALKMQVIVTVPHGCFQKLLGESNCPVSISIAMLYITFFHLMNVVDNIGCHNNHHLICLETQNSKSFVAVHSAANGETFAAMWAKMTFMR